MDAKTMGCAGCRGGAGLDFDFKMAFQPIVRLTSKSVWAHEALVRGVDGSGAGSVLSRVNEDNRYAFDQACRVKAIETAGAIGMSSMLSINFMPNAVYQPEACIRATLAAAGRANFRLDRLMFEVTEDERSMDVEHLCDIFAHYKSRGFATALDDFGAGYSGLALLSNFVPDVVKIDMGLVRGVDVDKARRAIVKGVVAICEELGVEPLGEGVETAAEIAALADMGVDLFQGYALARPALEAMPAIDWSAAGL